MKRLILLLVFSLGLGLTGLYVATREAVFSPATYSPPNLTLALGLFALLNFLLLWSAPVLKLILLARAQGVKLRVRDSFLAHVAQVFGSAMTPSGTGGGPLLLLALERVGVPAGTGLGIAVQLFVLDLVSLGVLIPLGLAYLIFTDSIALSPSVSWLSAVAAVVALLLALFLVRFPKPLTQLLFALSHWRPLRRFDRALRRVGKDYYASAKTFRQMHPGTWLALHATNLIAWLTSFSLFWAMLRIYGSSVGPLDVLSVLSIIALFSFFVPTPGASGVLELLLGLAVAGGNQSSIAAPVVWWRAGTFYIAYLLGPLSAWVLLAQNPPEWLHRRPAGEGVKGAESSSEP